MAVPRLTLYLDIVSPFAYLAYYVTRHSPTFAKCSVTYVPIFLGGLMKACENTPPLKIKNKDKWIDLERRRWARAFSVPMVDDMPKGFPPLTLAVMRAVCAVSVLSPNQLIPCLDALYRSFWVEGNANIGKPEGFMPVLEKTLGGTAAEEVLKASSEPRIKDLLTSNTDKAFQSGAFGLPWFECTNTEGKTEGFWGVDHLGQVVNFLGLDRSLDGGFKSLL
ncbi:hypothetical protein VTN77DRAFT_5056 [Rasamsonia byssochlamydoides]|uniref:uncharacterized protein n=1 Tax=Rasamsonia byssochlamydoides TaxID=89139 RepID=UPI00374308F9